AAAQAAGALVCRTLVSPPIGGVSRITHGRAAPLLAMNAFHPFRESLRARGRAGLSLLSCASLCVLLMLSTSTVAVAQTYVFDGTLNSYTGTSNPNLSGTATTSDLDLGLGTP